MRNLVPLLIILIAILPATSLAQEPEPVDPAPQALLDAAVDHLQAAESFRLAIEQSGEPYPLALSLDGVNLLPATLQSAEAQYIQPNELHISAQLQLFIPLSLDIYSLDDRQWLSFPSGAPWILMPAFEDFDVNRLLAPDDGIEYLVANLQDPQLIPPDTDSTADDSTTDETTSDEPALIHIGARADGAAVAGLLFGFIEPQDDVDMIASITEEDGRLSLIEITMLETLGDPDAEPSVWLIRFHDYDAPRAFEPPTS